jgi:transporter family-2 protein
MLTTLALVLMVVAAGSLLPFQSGINSMLSRQLGHPLSAAIVNFVVGIAALTLGAVVFRAPMQLSTAAARTPAWAWLGGLCGATIVVMAMLTAPRLGASLVFGSLIAGQIGGSVVLDHFGWAGYPVHPLSATRTLGLCALVVGLVLIKKG